MTDQDKSKEELLRELRSLREKVAALESLREEFAQVEGVMRMAVLSAKEEKAKTEAFLAAMGDAVSIQDTNYRVLYQNEAHKKLVGEHTGEVCYRAYNNKESVCENCPLALCFGDGAIHIVEKDGARDKGILRVEITASPLKDEKGAIVAGIEIVRNITERRKAEEGLRAAEEKFRSLVEQSITGIYIIQDGRLVYVNPKCSEIFGCTVEEMLAAPSVLDFIAEEDRPLVAENIRKRISGDVGSLHYTFKGLRGDGTVIDIEAHGGQTVYDGKPSIMGTLIDVTSRRKLQEEIFRAQKLESFGMMAGYMAHQFNNILTVLSGNILLAKMYAKPESEVFDILAEAEKAAHQAEGLTRQLLAFAKDRTMTRTTIAVQDMFNDFFGSHARHENVRYDIRESGDLWHLDVDEALIHQALDNIIENAVQATPPGGVIAISAENIAVDAGSPLPLKAGDYVRLSVADQGPGIDSRNLDRIFEPFFTTRQGSVGLGLTSSASIIRNHGGHIAVDSADGSGAVFHLFLPAARASGAPQQEKRNKAFPGKKRVLVMDDEELIRTVMDRMLTQCGCVADFARNGEEMLLLYRQAMDKGQPYDAVIVDLIISEGIGGEEAMHRLRELDPRACAIVTSGYTDKPAMTDFRKFGFKLSLAKPYTISELCDALHDILDDKG